ncbi:MAG: oligopeptide/dipeptide ABC transporter ATP-binding protein [Eubacteriales bacterium]
MLLCDIMVSFPGMALAIAVCGMLGAGIMNAVIAITAVSFTKYARLSRSSQGEVPSATNLPKGCPFASRCSECIEICKNEIPKMKEVAERHQVACHLFSGANQIYAEAGANPRDAAENTETSRGFSVKMAKEMLKDAEWEV